MAQKPPEGRTSPAMRQAEAMFTRSARSRVNADGSERKRPAKKQPIQLAGQMDVYDCLIQVNDDERFFFEQ